MYIYMHVYLCVYYVCKIARSLINMDSMLLADVAITLEVEGYRMRGPSARGQLAHGIFRTTYN